MTDDQSKSKNDSKLKLSINSASSANLIVPLKPVVFVPTAKQPGATPLSQSEAPSEVPKQK